MLVFGFTCGGESRLTWDETLSSSQWVARRFLARLWMQSICLEITTDRERERGSYERKQDMVSFLTPVKRLTLHLVAGHLGFISFAGAERANCRRLILTSCFNPCFTFTQSRHPPSWHYAGLQGAPLNKTRITFRWSYLPKEVLTWFSLRTLRKLACLKCAEQSVGKRVGGWPLTVSSGLQSVCSRR